MRLLNRKLIITDIPLKNDLWANSLTIIEDGEVVELQLYSYQNKDILGNVYIGRVEKVLPQLNCAFVYVQPGLSCHYLMAKGEKIKVGDQIPVQVAQEALKEKAPRVTSNLELNGRYLVLSRYPHSLAVSSKISQNKKEKVKAMIAGEDDGQYGILLRTAAADASKDEILEEYKALKLQMTEILEKSKTRSLYSCLYEGSNPVGKALKDYCSDEFQIITDQEESFHKIKSWLFSQGISDSVLCFYQDKLLPLYKLYSLERVLDDALKTRVWMKSGAFLMIEQTEAFVSIDVNSGKLTKAKKNQDLIKRVNFEAAKEIAGQLRLRNLYGMILIDFINMKEEYDREELLQYLRNCFRKDHVKTEVVDMTKLQIAECIRNKSRKSLKEQISLIYK